MFKKIYVLAFQNIKKNKKYFMVVASIVLFLTIFYHTIYIYQASFRTVEKIYNNNNYGEWYIQGRIIDGDPTHQKVSKLKKEFHDKYEKEKAYNNFQYCFAYQQNKEQVGFDNIGYFDKDYMQLCHVQFIDGIKPKKSKEIAISTKFQQEHDVHLNEEVIIHINNQLKKCRIVGIYENSQINLFDICVSIKDATFEFPFVYSNSSLHYTPQSEQAKTELYTQIALEEEYNQYGYDHNTIQSSIELTHNQLITLFNVFMIVSVLLICLSQTAYRKRMHEFALYRSIGMTTYQLAFLMLCEICIVVIGMIVLGTILSLGVSYLLMLYVEQQFKTFAYIIDSNQMLLNCFILFIAIIIINLIPIIQSVNIALSGAFGTKKFSYFSYKQKRLKKVNRLRLGFKELMGNYFVIVCLVLFFSFFSAMAVVNQFGQTPLVKGQCHYILNIQSLNAFPNELIQSYPAKIFKVAKADLFIPQYQGISQINKIIALDDEKFFKPYQSSSITHPKINKEIGQQYVYVLDTLKKFPVQQDCQIKYYILSDQYQLEKTTLYSEENGKTKTEIKDTLQGQGNYMLSVSQDDYSMNYYIKGFLNKNKILYNDIPIYTSHYFPEDAIYMNQNEFHLLFQNNYTPEAYIYFKDKTDLDHYYNNLIQFKDIQIKYDNEYKVYENTINQFHKLFVPISVVIAVMFVTFIVLMYMNLSEIEMHKHDYFLQRLLGMTDMDILIKQFIKAMIVFGLLSIFTFIFTVLQATYYMQKFQFFHFITILTIQFVMLIIDYVFPLLFVLKDQDFIKIQGRES